MSHAFCQVEGEQSQAEGDVRDVPGLVPLDKCFAGTALAIGANDAQGPRVDQHCMGRQIVWQQPQTAVDISSVTQGFLRGHQPGRFAQAMGRGRQHGHARHS